MRLAIRLIFLSLAISFVLAGCFKIPERPQWDMGYTVPFAERIYRLSDMIDVAASSSSDTALRRIRLSGEHGFYGLHDTLVFYASGRISPQTFYNKIKTDPQDQKRFDYTIDQLTLDSLNCGGSLMRASDLGFPTGTTIPAITGQRMNIRQPYSTSGTGFIYFDYFDYTSGNMTLILVNNLPVRLDSVRVYLLDTLNVMKARSSVLLTLPPRVTDTIPLVITGPRIYNRMVVVCSTKVHDTTNIRFTGNDFISSTFLTGRIRVSEARASFPAQRASADSLIETGVDDDIYSAEVRTGRFNISIYNHMDVTIDSLRVKFLDFRTATGDTLTRLYSNIAASGTRTDVLPLDRISIVLDSTVHPQRFRSTGRAYTRGVTYPDMRIMRGSDGVQFTYSLDTLKFSRFRGIPDSIVFNLDPDTTFITDRPSGVTDLGLTYAELVLTPRTSVSYMPLKMDYHLEATRGLVRRTYDTNNVYFASMNDIVRFRNTQGIVNIIPDRIVSQGIMRTGRHFISNMRTVSVSETDTVSGFGTLEGPMFFRIQPQTMIPDPEKHEGKDQPLTRIDFRIAGENRLPIGGNISIEICSDTSDTVTNRWLAIGGARVTRPVISPVTHRATSSTLFDTTLVLRDSLVNIFKRPVFYTRSRLDMTGTGTDTVLAYGADYIKLRCSAKLTVNTSGVQ